MASGVETEVIAMKGIGGFPIINHIAVTWSALGTVGNVCIEVELGLLTSKLVAIPIPIPIRTYEKIVER